MIGWAIFGTLVLWWFAHRQNGIQVQASLLPSPAPVVPVASAIPAVLPIASPLRPVPILLSASPAPVHVASSFAGNEPPAPITAATVPPAIASIVTGDIQKNIGIAVSTEKAMGDYTGFGVPLFPGYNPSAGQIFGTGSGNFDPSTVFGNDLSGTTGFGGGPLAG